MCLPKKKCTTMFRERLFVLAKHRTTKMFTNVAMDNYGISYSEIYRTIKMN